MERVTPEWNNLRREQCLVIKGTKTGLPESSFRSFAKDWGITIKEEATPKKKKKRANRPKTIRPKK
ncbi:MAG: hypothetical protein WCT16_01595 [Candidatus Buchananbacteria bacterium]